jgi:hypothetical protein
MLHAEEIVCDEYAQVVDVELLPLERKRRFDLKGGEGDGWMGRGVGRRRGRWVDLKAGEGEG